MSMLRLGIAVAAAGLAAGCGTDPRPYSTFLLDKEPRTQLAAFEANPCSIYFDLDSAAIRSDQERTLDGCARLFVGDTDVTVSLEGHADERGSDAHNLALGEQRARAVQAELVERGVPAQRVAVSSFGEKKAAGGGEAAWSKSRRVDIATRK